jgi:ankyrin repeat protein
LLIQECQANVEAKNNEGCTPLHIACGMNRKILWYVPGMVKNLIQKCGANVEATDNHGRTPLHYAIGTCDKDYRTNNKLEVARYLVKECHVKVDVNDNDGTSPLSHICREFDLDTIYFFVQHGCVNLIDRISRMKHL